ncbi:Asp23/Gls24 family envelope stress response protein [Streptosporangium sp. NPDC023615]|uniref:Asp23/Gls24 family envelope stress response protein n=1 Tax=Streptosporangium sp. NPDC023615 TaxID=3154794 RepID=UPI00342C2FA1
MTDVSVEGPTEETASPSEASGRPARPFSLSLSLSAVEPPLPSLSEPVPSPGEPAPSREEPSSDGSSPDGSSPDGFSPDGPGSSRKESEPFAAQPLLTVVEEGSSPVSPPGSLPVPSSSSAPSPYPSSADRPDGPLSAARAGDALGEPEPTPQPVPAVSATPPAPSHSPSPSAGAVVKGRIKVADEVVEKVAALAALEVAGVAELRDDAARAAEPARLRAGSAGAGRGPRGVSAHVQDRTAAVDVTIVTEYGHVVMDVANEVKTNVARTISRMLGMRVVEVNVNVDDVRLPGETGRTAPAGPAQGD